MSVRSLDGLGRSSGRDRGIRRASGAGREAAVQMRAREVRHTEMPTLVNCRGVSRQYPRSKRSQASEARRTLTSSVNLIGSGAIFT